MMENNKKNFWKGALAGALAMFMVGAAALGIMNVAGVDLGTSQEKVVNAQEEKKLNKLKKLIDENYLYTDDLKEEDQENGLYSGYINALGDPYSVYYDEEQTKSLQESTSGEYSGIGVVFSQNQETKVITAVQVYENSPANEAGIQVNDILYKVGDKDVSGTDLSDVVQLICCGVMFLPSSYSSSPRRMWSGRMSISYFAISSGERSQVLSEIIFTI